MYAVVQKLCRQLHLCRNLSQQQLRAIVQAAAAQTGAVTDSCGSFCTNTDNQQLARHRTRNEGNCSIPSGNLGWRGGGIITGLSTAFPSLLSMTNLWSSPTQSLISTGQYKQTYCTSVHDLFCFFRHFFSKISEI